jgi:chorismate mutase-like protein
MPRKPEGPSTANSAAPSPRPAAAARNLQNLRTQIDKLDVQLLKLINERAGLAAEIGKHKADAGEEVFSPVREKELIHNLLQLNDKQNGPLPANAVEAIFREIISGSRALQKVLRVAYLGPESRPSSARSSPARAPCRRCCASLTSAPNTVTATWPPSSASASPSSSCRSAPS